MHKRSASNYSLWPEQARPRRGKGVTLAAGGFAIGIACAIALNNVISDAVNPPPDQDLPRQVAMEDYAPVYATPVFAPAIIPPPPVRAASTTGASVTPTPAAVTTGAAASVSPTRPKPADLDEKAKRSRTAARAPAELARPASGTFAAGPSAATDGRGGGIVDITTPTTLGALNPVLGTTRPPEEGPEAQQGTTRKKTSAPAAEGPTVKKPRNRASQRVERVERKKRRKSRRSNYAARYRSGPVYGARGQVMRGGGGADY